MRLLLLLLTWASLVTHGQASGVKLQRGVLDRGLVSTIAALPQLYSSYHNWGDKQHWLQNPDTYPELGALLTQLGVSGEAFIQAMTQFGEIYPAVWDMPPFSRDGHKLSKDEFPNRILSEVAIEDGKVVELFTRLLEEPQTLLAKAKRRIALLTEIAARGQDPIYDSEYDQIWLRANMLRASRIGLSWETYIRLVNDDKASLADFVYMRYAVGEDQKSNALFNSLLAEYGLSRADFDVFFAANKHNYADLNKRKDIMDRILGVVLTSTLGQKGLGREMYSKLGINTSIYVAYVYEGEDLSLWVITSMEQAIGAEEKLRAPLDALLVDNGVSRDEFEQALDAVFGLYSVWYPYNHGNREMTRGSLLDKVRLFPPATNYFEALVTKAGNVALPEKAMRRSAILKQMFETKEPTQASFYNRLRQLGIRDESYFFSFLVAAEGAEVKELSSSSMDELLNMRYAVGKDQQLDALFNSLLAEYGLSRADFDVFFAANKDNYVGFHYDRDITFRDELAKAKTSP